MKVVAAAIAASLVVSPAIASPVLYGEIHFSINKFEELNNGELRMDSHHSAVGIKGSEDLGHGVKLIYKAEFGYDTTEGNGGSDGDPATEEAPSLVDRDQWLGFADKEFGVIRFGTISTGYKSSGVRLDPLYKTVFEQRGYLGMQSSLHDGSGVNGGRSTNTIRVDSAEFQGAKLVAGYSLGEVKENTSTFGIHYERTGLVANIDYLKSESLSASAVKFGLGYDFTEQFMMSFQYESADEVLFDAGIAEGHMTGVIDSVYKLDATYTSGNNAWIVAYGGQSGYSGSYALVVDHKFSANSDIYFGYAYKGFDQAGVRSDKVVAFGLRHKF